MEKIKRMFSISCLGLFVGVAFAWAVDAHAQDAANADQVINFIGFQQLEDASRIYIRTDVTPSYRVERPDEQTIEVVFNAAEVAVKTTLASYRYTVLRDTSAGYHADSYRRRFSEYHSNHHSASQRYRILYSDQRLDTFPDLQALSFPLNEV